MYVATRPMERAPVFFLPVQRSVSKPDLYRIRIRRYSGTEFFFRNTLLNKHSKMLRCPISIVKPQKNITQFKHWRVSFKWLFLQKTWILVFPNLTIILTIQQV